MQTVYPQVQTKQKGPLSLHDIKHGILPRVGPSKPGRRFWQLMAGFLVIDSVVLVIVVFCLQIEQMALYGLQMSGGLPATPPKSPF